MVEGAITPGKINTPDDITPVGTPSYLRQNKKSIVSDTDNF